MIALRALTATSPHIDDGPSGRPVGALTLWALIFALLLAGTAGATDYTFEWQNPKPQGNGLYALGFEDALTGYSLGLNGAVLVTIDGGVTWTDRTDFATFMYDIEDVLVLGAGDLLAVGESPGIFRSFDGGSSWTPVTNPSTGRLYDVHVIPGGTFSAIGDFGEIVHSTDGGANWTLVPQSFERKLFGQYWWDDSHGYVVGEHFLRSTDDGGATWTPLPDAPENWSYTDIYFLDSMNGWLLQHFTTWRTIDGGVSWFEKHGPFAESPIYQEEALFFDHNHRLIITLLEGAQIWETTDDGDSWVMHYQRNNTAGYADIEQLAGGSLVVCSSDGDLLRSTDNGQNWGNFTQSPEDADRNVLETITFLPSGKAFAGGRGGLWLASSDWGETWEIPPVAPDISTVNCIAFRTDDFGLAGGYTPSQSKIFRTTDGGASWTPHLLAPSYSGYARGFAIPDDNVCYTVVSGAGPDNHVYRSEDGGVTWDERDSGITSNIDLDSIFFLDVDTGFVGGGEYGAGAYVWKTIDGATSWTQLGLAGLGEGSVYDMYWTNELTGVLLTSQGVYRTVDGGASCVHVLDESTGRLDFRDAMHGVATSRFYPRVWVTADGGVTWEQVDHQLDSYVDDVASVPDGFVLCGNGSVIYMGREWATSVDGDLGGGYPASSLLRVWPNPFNPATTIAMTLAEPSNVELAVHDVTGRRVAVLANGYHEAGELIATWDGKDAAGREVGSGVYFVLGKAGRTAAAAKVVLAK